MADQVSEVLDLVEVRGVISGGLAPRGAWISRTPVDDPLKLFAVARGGVSLLTDGISQPIELRAGDVAVLNHRTWLELRGSSTEGLRREVDPPVGLPSRADLTDADDVLFGGRVALNDAGADLVRHALPPVAQVRAGDPMTSHLRRHLLRLLHELQDDRLGAAFAVRQHAQLLLLEMIRTAATEPALPPGWLRLLTDQRLRPALALMHDSPGHAWTLHELARAAMMSRTTFAERFRRESGIPPLAYLTRWRMLLARRALRSRDISIGALATELGYSSDSAFTTAFTRAVGQSPLRYRRAKRSPAPAS